MANSSFSFFLATLCCLFSLIYATVMIPDLGWYSIAYEGLTTKHFRVTVDKITTLYLTGCNCPGDQFYLLDNGNPVVLIFDCADSFNPPDKLLPTCNNPLSSPLECILSRMSGKRKETKEIAKSDTSIKSSESSCKGEGYCMISGFILPGQHNITVIVTKANYPFNVGYITAATACSSSTGEFLPCCALADITTPFGACSNAIIG